MERASNKKQWIAKADDLLAAASILKPEVEKHYRSWKNESIETPITRDGIVEVYMMLVGCAFENLLKGVYVRQLTRGQKGNRILTPELPKALIGHDLMWLVQQLGLEEDLTSLQINLLKRLKETIVWRGRYPVPTKHTEMITKFRKSTNDLATVEGLVAKFKKPIRLTPPRNQKVT